MISTVFLALWLVSPVIADGVEPYVVLWPDGTPRLRAARHEVDGKLEWHGRFEQWDRLGRLVAEGIYADGRRSGTWSFRSAGEERQRGPYKNGARVGRWRGILPGGGEDRWLTGVLKRKKVALPFGFAAGTLLNGVPHGTWVITRKDGTEVVRGEQHLGLWHGDVYFRHADATYDPDMISGHYHRGERIGPCLAPPPADFGRTPSEETPAREIVAIEARPSPLAEEVRLFQESVDALATDLALADVAIDEGRRRVVERLDAATTEIGVKVSIAGEGDLVTACEAIVRRAQTFAELLTALPERATQAWLLRKRGVALGGFTDVPLLPHLPIYVPRSEPRLESGVAKMLTASADWLAAHQAPDGSLSAYRFREQCPWKTPCYGEGDRDVDIGVTALTLLAWTAMPDKGTSRLPRGGAARR